MFQNSESIYTNDFTYGEIQLTPTHDVIKECAFHNDLKIEDKNFSFFNGKNPANIIATTSKVPDSLSLPMKSTCFAV